MAAEFATPDDVAVVWRDLTAAEELRAWSLLTSASAKVRARVANVDSRIADGTLDAALVRGIVVDMVLRVMRNPEGVRQRTVGGVSVTLADDDLFGRLGITDQEVALLMPAGATAFGSIRLCVRW